MEIDLGFGREGAAVGIGLLVALLIGLALLGRAVTPLAVDDAKSQPRALILTPERWQAARLARQARSETEALRRDVESLRALLDGGAPDPVAAMLLAQRVYTRHRTGTSAMAAARLALIEAARVTALYASGSAPRQDAIDAFNGAQARLETLQEAAQTVARGSRRAMREGPHVLFLPLVTRQDAVGQSAHP